MALIDDRDSGGFIDDRQAAPSQQLQPWQKSQHWWNVPEDMSREGLGAISDAANKIPESYTGNLPRDLAVNAPKFLATTAAETAQKVAPSFVSPLALAGNVGELAAAAPEIASIPRWIGKGLEATSGLGYRTPGVLAEAAKDPTLIFAKGKQAAGELYDAAKTTPEGENIGQDLEQTLTHNGFVTKVYQKIQDGTATAEEALSARQSLDKIKNSVPQATFYSLRAIFDDAAKARFGAADAAYQRGFMADALRTPYAFNKSGSPSIVKQGVQYLMPHSAMLFSPLVQGIAATGAGIVSRNAGYLGAAPGIYDAGKEALSNLLNR